MYDGWTSGVKTKCPKCGSDDCNDTTGHQTVVGIKVAAHVVYCNTCGYQKEELLKDGGVIWSKEKGLQKEVSCGNNVTDALHIPQEL
jgi:hypothetical protein